MIIKKLETKLDSFKIYSIFKNRNKSFFLDSGMDSEKLGKYSFIGFDPIEELECKNHKIVLKTDKEIVRKEGDPFEELKKITEKYKVDYSGEIPFIGGIVGNFSYDLCHYVEKLPRTAKDDVEFPDLSIGVYDGIIAIDHQKEESYIIAVGFKKEAEVIIDKIEKTIKENEKKGIQIELVNSKIKPEFKSNFKSKELYKESIEKVRSYIESGDVYQVNLTQRFESEIDITPFELYAKLRHINPAPFASYIDLGDFKIVSSSPERFIKIKNGVIETRPIKGTINRGKTPDEDKANREQLCNSEKDKAELLMIVDLERNDLSRVAKIGTVKVRELFHLEEYATVYHLVATVTAEVKENIDAIDCIKASFPGGSITGAPKIRAMEVIDELEPTQRNIYTGAIGYIGFNGDTDLNIVIRTVLCKGNKVYFQVGGGITWDSNPELEYQETLHKAEAMIKAISM